MGVLARFLPFSHSVRTNRLAGLRAPRVRLAQRGPRVLPEQRGRPGLPGLRGRVRLRRRERAPG